MKPADLRLLALLQDGLPLEEDPFAAAAGALGTTPGEVVDRLGAMIADGTVRRFGARIDQRRLGLVANAVIAWRVPADRVESVGELFAARPEVTHCYERRRVPGIWEHTLFVVVHAPDPATVERMADRLAEAAGLDDRVVLLSTAEYKRRPTARVEVPP